MRIDELSVDNREAIKFQQESFQSIEEFEVKVEHYDFIKYVKMICKYYRKRNIKNSRNLSYKKLKINISNKK